MRPDDLPERIARSLPPPPEALRLRVLAAAKARWQTKASPPWWWRVRTWAAAAAVLAVCDIAVTAGPSRGATEIAKETSVKLNAPLPPDAPTLLALIRAFREENQP